MLNFFQHLPLLQGIEGDAESSSGRNDVSVKKQVFRRDIHTCLFRLHHLCRILPGCKRHLYSNQRSRNQGND